MRQETLDKLYELGKKYNSPADHLSAYYMIPIERLEEVQALFREVNCPIRCRFRGPRITDMYVLPNGHIVNRSKDNKQSVCLKMDATHFSVYARKAR